jgi:hypothetical protein
MTCFRKPEKFWTTVNENFLIVGRTHAIFYSRIETMILSKIQRHLHSITVLQQITNENRPSWRLKPRLLQKCKETS